MRKKVVFIFLLPCYLVALDEKVQSLQALFEFISANQPDELNFRAPTPPNTLGASIGKMIFQGYNGGTVDPYTIGAEIGGYSALPTPTTPTANQTFPANIIMSTVPSSGSTGVARMSVQSNGRVGIGNFAPTDTTTANAALNVEGSTGLVANSTMHIGARTTGLTGFTSMTGATSVNYNLQVDGNLLVNNRTLVNNATTPANATGQFNLTPCIHIRSIPAAGLTLSTPGVYCLANNLTYVPSGANPAISITSSGVILDLQSFSITQDLTTPIAGVNGISIGNSLTDVMVMNGKIVNFTGTGIVSGNSQARIALQDLSFIQCSIGAISVVGIASPRNDTLYVNNCKAVLCGQVGVSNSIVAIQQTNNVFINATKVSQGLSASGNANGILISSANNVVATNVRVSDSTAAAFIGIYLLSVVGGSFSQCQVAGNNNNSGAAGSEIAGMRIESSNGLELYECYIMNNTSTVSAAVVRGILTVGSVGIVFDRCVSCGQSATGGGTPTIATRGMFINNTSAGITVKNCIFYRNDAESPNVPAGVEVQGNSCLFFNCTAHSQLDAVASTILGTGFLMTATSTTVGLNNSFIYCNSFNQINGFALALSGGALNTQNQFIKNVSTKNSNQYVGLPGGSITAATLATLGTALATVPWTNVAIA